MSEEKSTEEIIHHSKNLIALHNEKKRAEEAKRIFELLPQGKGSGLNADLLDNLHAKEIIEKAVRESAKIPVKAPAMGGGAGVTDHGALTGLGDDDHTIYLLVNGTRAATGALKILAPADGDALLLGDATHEGGDISVYGDASGNRSLHFDADLSKITLWEAGVAEGTGKTGLFGTDIVKIIDGSAKVHCHVSDTSAFMEVYPPSGSGSFYFQATPSMTRLQIIDPTGYETISLQDGTINATNYIWAGGGNVKLLANGSITLAGTVDGVDVSALKPHALDSATYHSGSITDAQHGTKTTIPNAHHAKYPFTYQNVKGTTDASTTSTDFVDFPQMTLTVATSGTYLIVFTMAGLVHKEAPAGNIIMAFQLLIDGVVTMGCNLGGRNLEQLRGFSSFITVRSLTAGKVVKIQWKVTYAGTTGYCRVATLITENREFTILKLA